MFTGRQLILMLVTSVITLIALSYYGDYESARDIKQWKLEQSIFDTQLQAQTLHTYAIEILGHRYAHSLVGKGVKAYTFNIQAAGFFIDDGSYKFFLPTKSPQKSIFAWYPVDRIIITLVK